MNSTVNPLQRKSPQAYLQVKSKLNPIKSTTMYSQEHYKLMLKSIGRIFMNGHQRSGIDEQIKETEQEFQNQTKMIEMASKIMEEKMNYLVSDVGDVGSQHGEGLALTMHRHLAEESLGPSSSLSWTC